jgi:hypothetical protein
MAGVLSYALSLNTAGFTNPLKMGEQGLNALNATSRVASAGIGSMLKPLAAAAAGIGAMVGAAVGLNAFRAGVKGAFDLGGALSDLSARTGASVRDLAILQQAFVDNGISAESVGPNINRLQKALAGISEEGQPTAKAFQSLGLDMARLRGLDAAAQMDAVGKAINALPSAADRSAAAMAIFGRSGGEMLTLFADSNAIGNVTKTLGGQAELLQKNAAAFDRASDLLGSSGLKMRGFFVGVADKVISGVLPLLEAFNGLDLSALGQQVGGLLMELGKAVSGLLGGLRGGMTNLLSGAQDAINGISAAVALAKDAIANGRLGELLGLSLRAGFEIGADFGLRALQFVAEGFGKYLGWVFDSSVSFFTNLLSGGFNTFFAGLGESFLGVGRLILASIGGPFRDIVASFQAGLAVAIDTVMAGLSKIPFLSEKIGTGWGGLTFDDAKAEILGDLDSGKELAEAKKQIKDGVAAMFPGTGGSALDDLFNQLREKLPGLSESLADQLGDAGESMADALNEQSDKIAEAGAATAAALAPPKDAEQSRRRGVRNPFETLMGQFEREAKRGKLGTGDATDMMERFLDVSPSRRAIVERATGFKGVAAPSSGASLHHLATDALSMPFDGLATTADALNRANAAADPRPGRGTPAADPAARQASAMLRVVEEIRDLFFNLATA